MIALTEVKDSKLSSRVYRIKSHYKSESSSIPAIDTSAASSQSTPHEPSTSKLFGIQDGASIGRKPICDISVDKFFVGGEAIVIEVHVDRHLLKDLPLVLWVLLEFELILTVGSSFLSLHLHSGLYSIHHLAEKSSDPTSARGSLSWLFVFWAFHVPLEGLLIFVSFALVFSPSLTSKIGLRLSYHNLA